MDGIERLKTTEFLTEGETRRLYMLEDRTVIKVPKSTTGYEKSQYEYRVYGRLPDEIKSHICPILGYHNGCVKVMKATPLGILLQQGDIEMEDMERMIATKTDVVDYLETHFCLDRDNLQSGMSWGILKGNVVLLDFGCIKS